jgi:ACS family hexuronate transporter-like MFS transporter
VFPRRAVGSIVGIGGFAGAMGGFCLQLSAGQLKQLTGNYVVLFGIAATAYVIALLLVHLFIPRVEPVEISVPENGRP